MLSRVQGLAWLARSQARLGQLGLGQARQGHTAAELWAGYDQARAWLECKKLPPDVDSFGVFCNDRIDLSEVEVYGYDYDYTLASYKKGVEYLIHDIAREHLVKRFGYPTDIGSVTYDPQFPIRGLHYDIQKGLFLKVDSSHQIQLGTVYRGRQKLPDTEVMSLYPRRQLSASCLEPPLPTRKHGSDAAMVQLVDIFSKPEMSLMAAVTDYFQERNLEYQPESLHYDVSSSVGAAHATFHSETRSNPQMYLHRDPQLVPWLHRLTAANKKVFLITNSPFETVDAGMSYMVGPDWREFFDVIIVQAGKPHFFKNAGKPIRELDLGRNIFTWDRVSRLDKGKIYAGGTIEHFQRLTGWTGGRVMYFGDHPYADLADVTLQHGWHTAAVIRELEMEIRLMNTEEFKWGVNWQQVLLSLIEEKQDEADGEEAVAVVEEWSREVVAIQDQLRTMFNPQFGSTFRSYNNATYFSRKLFRFSDLYTSRVTNLNQYKLTHTFHPRRGVLPHEFKSWFV